MCLCQSYIIFQLGNFGGQPKLLTRYWTAKKINCLRVITTEDCNSREWIPGGLPCKTTTLGCTCTNYTSCTNTSLNKRGLHQSREWIPRYLVGKTTTLGCTYISLHQLDWNIQLRILRNTRADSIVFTPSVKLVQIASQCIIVFLYFRCNVFWDFYFCVCIFVLYFYIFVFLFLHQPALACTNCTRVEHSAPMLSNLANVKESRGICNAGSHPSLFHPDKIGRRWI